MARDYFENDEDRRDHYRRLHALLGATMVNAEEVERAWADWCDRWPSEPAAARAVCDYAAAMLGERDFDAVMDALKGMLNSATSDY